MYRPSSLAARAVHEERRCFSSRSNWRLIKAVLSRSASIEKFSPPACCTSTQHASRDSKSSADGRLSPHRRLHWRINDVRTWWVGLWPRKMRPIWLRIRTWWLRFRVWHCDLRLICRRSNASLEVSFPTMYYSQPWPPDPELQSVDLAAGLLVLPDESPVRNRLVHATIPAKHA